MYVYKKRETLIISQRAPFFFYFYLAKATTVLLCRFLRVGGGVFKDICGKYRADLRIFGINGYDKRRMKVKF